MITTGLNSSFARESYKKKISKLTYHMNWNAFDPVPHRYSFNLDSVGTTLPNNTIDSKKNTRLTKGDVKKQSFNPAELHYSCAVDVATICVVTKFVMAGSFEFV